jgi:hypothetical protein
MGPRTSQEAPASGYSDTRTSTLGGGPADASSCITRACPRTGTSRADHRARPWLPICVAAGQNDARLGDRPPDTGVSVAREGALPPGGGQPASGLSVPFTDLSFRSLYHLAVTRIEISAAAHAALAASATRGLVEPLRSPEGGYFIWLAPKALKRLEAVRGPSESYSAAVLRLAAEAVAT